MPAAAELRELNDVELANRLREFKEELFNLRFQNATSELENTAGLKRAKREIARALTIQRERELNSNG